MKIARDFFDQNKFIEVETPYLTKSTRRTQGLFSA